MVTVTGTLKPRSADSAFGFLTPDDGTQDVYIRFSDVTDKTLGDLYGCNLVVEVKPSKKGWMVDKIIEVRGEPTAIPSYDTNTRKTTNKIQQSSFETSPGQQLSKWANINLIDHQRTIDNDDGTTSLKEYKSCLPELHKMLLAGEEWDFESEKLTEKRRILENYIRFMFYRIGMEGKISYSKDGSIAIFDTGLVDNLFEPIYGVFRANASNAKRPYSFEGWCSAGRGQLGKKILTPFDRLPDRAEFFSNINDVVLPRDIEVVEQWEHIIDDGVKRGRYPAKFLKKYVPENFNFDENRAEPGASGRQKYLEQAMNAIQDGSNYLEFKHKIESCIKTALKRVEWNYKTAIPIYHPRRNKMSIALPLALFDSETADLALILEKKNIRTYYASTVLTLDQAYLSARLVCRPLSDWLTTNVGIVGYAIED